MQFETQRLIIRPWQPNQDARHAMDIYGDRQVMAWVDDSGRDTSIRQVQGRLQRYQKRSICGRLGIGSWAVEQKDIGRVIGHVGIVPLPDIKVTQSQRFRTGSATLAAGEFSTEYFEIDCQFRPSSWGFGYASEAAACIAQYAFEELKLPMLLAILQPGNKRSIALVERLGMQCDGLTTRYYRGEMLLLYKLSADKMKVKTQRSVELGE